MVTVTVGVDFLHTSHVITSCGHLLFPSLKWEHMWGLGVWSRRNTVWDPWVKAVWQCRVSVANNSWAHTGKWPASYPPWKEENEREEMVRWL